MTGALPVGERLRAAPHLFDPLQAMRLLELGGAHVGGDTAPDAEPFSIETTQSLAFLAVPLQAATVGADRRTRLRVGFLGLTGPLGILPQFYDEMVVRANRLRNRAVASFLDLFGQRLVGLFLRASEKYRIALTRQHALSAERRQDGAAATAATAPDPIAQAMRALTGHGTPGLAGRTTLRDDTLLYFAGLFAARNRSATALQGMLAAYLGVPVRIEQFTGRWIAVAPDEQSRLVAGNDGAFSQLGEDAMLGSRVWDAQGTFRVVVGPLRLAQMRALMPHGDTLPRLVDLVRSFVGPEFSFDVQLILAAADVPDLHLDPAAGEDAPRLGWNSWVKSAPALADSGDIILDPDLVLTTAR